MQLKPLIYGQSALLAIASTTVFEHIIACDNLFLY